MNKNLPVRVPGQRRVAMAGGNVPDFDGAVPTAAGDKLVVRRKSNGVDPVIETSQHMKHSGRDQDSQGKKTYWSECPFTVDSKDSIFQAFTFPLFRAYTHQIEVPFRVAVLTRNQTGT